MTAPVVVVVEPDGALVSIYSDALRFEGRAAIRRASRVEPTEDGAWTADLGPVGGPMLGPYATRAAALAAEHDYLTTRLLTGDTFHDQ